MNSQVLLLSPHNQTTSLVTAISFSTRQPCGHWNNCYLVTQRAVLRGDDPRYVFISSCSTVPDVVGRKAGYLQASCCSCANVFSKEADVGRYTDFNWADCVTNYHIPGCCRHRAPGKGYRFCGHRPQEGQYKQSFHGQWAYFKNGTERSMRPDHDDIRAPATVCAAFIACPAVGPAKLWPGTPPAAASITAS